MLLEMLTRNVRHMSAHELEEECRELEDAYAEALKDNATYEVLAEIWKRIKSLQHQLRENPSDGRS